MGTFLETFGKFVVEHFDLINALWEAIEGGAKKEDLILLIKQGQVAEADAQMHVELDKKT